MNTEKLNEISKIKNFVASLQDGYLGDIFKDTLPMIINTIENDMCVIPYWEMMQSKTELNKEILELKKQKHLLEKEMQDLKNNKEFLENSLIQAKQKLSTMAKMMLNAV
jgi:hypothetical protein